MAKNVPKEQGTLPGLAKRCLPNRDKKTQDPRSLAGLVSFFLRCFPDQGAFNYAQTRWAVETAMLKNGLTLDDMFIRVNRMAGKHVTMTPWELATCKIPERARRPDLKATPDLTDQDTDTSEVDEETRETVRELLRRNDTPWEEEQL